MKNKIELLLMNKNKLEAYGRTIGIELDRRLNKSTLIEELLNHTEKEPMFAEIAAAASVSIPDIDTAPMTSTVKTEVVSQSKYGLVRQGDSWSVSVGNREVYKTSSEGAAKRWIEDN